MKKIAFGCAVAMFALLGTSFTIAENQPNVPSENNANVKEYIVTTGENGEICDVKECDSYAWHIKDLSGYTNIRNKPNGKVCMRLKAHTQYAIYAYGSDNGWLSISSIYNMREEYWVRLHSSSTGTYWIAASILY